MKLKKYYLNSAIIGLIVGMIVFTIPKFPNPVSDSFIINILINRPHNFLYHTIKIFIPDSTATYARINFTVSFLLISIFWGLVIGLIIKLIKKIPCRSKNK